MFLRSLLSTCCLWQKVMAVKLNFSSTSVFCAGYIPLPGVHFWSIKHLPLFFKWCFPHVQCWLGGNSCKAGKNNYRDFCLSPFLSSRRGGAHQPSPPQKSEGCVFKVTTQIFRTYLAQTIHPFYGLYQMLWNAMLAILITTHSSKLQILTVHAPSITFAFRDPAFLHIVCS